MNAVASFVGERGLTASTKATYFIQTAQNLYRHLHHGFDGQALHRVPIAGDTSNLPFVEGLTQLERRLAWSQHFLARHLPGSQELRQLMEHSNFGARVVYGDCIFFTTSPNEQHSALGLRLSRFRVNDPFGMYSNAAIRREAQRDYPPLERTDIPLLEYDLRRAAAARDPLAVVSALPSMQ